MVHHWVIWVYYYPSLKLHHCVYNYLSLMPHRWGLSFSLTHATTLGLTFSLSHALSLGSMLSLSHPLFHIISFQLCVKIHQWMKWSSYQSIFIVYVFYVNVCNSLISALLMNKTFMYFLCLNLFCLLTFLWWTWNLPRHFIRTCAYLSPSYFIRTCSSMKYIVMLYI